MTSKDELVERFKRIIDAMGLDLVEVNEDGITLEWAGNREQKKFKPKDSG